MSERETDHTDDQDEIVGELRPVSDVLPPPDRLVLRDEGVKVTRTLSRRSIAFFKQEAKRNRVPWQRMIQALVESMRAGMAERVPEARMADGAVG
jgi:hypothetical protein